MNFTRKMKLNTLLSALCAVFLCCAIFVLVFSSSSQSANANTSVSGSSTSVGEIYDYDKVCYSEDALNELATQILSNDGSAKTIKDLLSAADRAGAPGTPISGSQHITVSYGRYGSTLEQKNTSPKSLSWIPVYLSKSTDGDAILTLYLDGTYKQSSAYSRMEAWTFTNSGTWSVTASDRAPSSSYGTSYMRAYVLGNGGTYYTYRSNNNGGTAGEVVVTESDANKFADFVTVVNAEGNSVPGVFTDDVVTPSKIKWQETESYAASIGQWEAGKDYNFPNEAYGTPVKGSFINSSGLGYGNRINYNIWQNDKVWLPSLTEVGTGDLTVDGTDTTNGIWKLTADERANVPGSGGAWLRTAFTGGDNPNPYTMFCTTQNGKSYETSAVSVSKAVRPAIHLNLTKISKKVTPPLNIPDTIRVTYNGATHNHASISQFDWYDPSAISGINFFSDEQALHVETPIDAGEYFIEIELSSLTSRYFLGEDPSTKTKIFKFVIEKAKLAVQWTYGHNDELNSSDNSLVPTAVNIVEDSDLCKIYQRDIEKEKVPVVGMKYYCQASGGPQGITDYPDVKGQYTAEPYIIGEDEYEYNYVVDKDLCRQVSLEKEPDKLDSERTITYTSWIFIVSERRIPIPEFSNGTAELILNYRGRQEVQIYNVTKYITITVESDFEYEAMEPNYESGIQTFWVEAVGHYTFKANINDKDNIVWLGEEGQYSKTETKELNLAIEKAHITVTLTGLLPSWESSRSVEVTLNLLGLYSQDSDVNIQAIFFGATWPETVLPITDNKVTIPYGLPVGRYTFVVRMTGQNPYYYMTEQVSQTFTVLTSPASFTDDNVVWQYTTGGSETINAVTGDHSTSANALVVPYTGNYYQFTLTMSETRLTQAGVRATYSGDTRVTNGGDYCVTVTISAYDKNVTFATKSYNLYFRISPSKYNLSGVEWNYDSPFSYTGEEHRVNLKAGTLPVGLSVTYITNGSATNTATNAGPYSTTATFTVLPEYASNYICPDANDASSYTGNFNFVCNWQINQKIINVAWTAADGGSNLFFVPALETGGNFVDYSYELYDGANWNAAEKVVSPETGTSRYRVTATLKAIYQANYVLYEPNNIYYKEFTVDSGKQAITVHIEINGERCDNGQQFTYTGNKFEATPVVDTGDLGVSDFTVKYYMLDASGNKSPQPLDSAPVSAGRYAAVVAITYENSDHSYISDESETEISFEIIRADYDMSDLSWQYIHENTVIVAHFNVNQGKWLDNNLNDVVFEYEYDGTPHNLQLVGAVSGLAWDVTDASYTDAGEYTAHIEFRPDENHNAPANFPVTLGWKITKAKVKLDDVKWGYTDISGVEHEFDFNSETLPYARNENGDVNYTVGLINLPDEIKKFFVYNTHYYNTNEDFTNANSFAAIGVYRTSFSISIPANYNPGANYEAFKASDMPSFISSSQVWEISETPLTKPEYKGGWDIFDSNTHYLLDMCGVPEEQLYFFDIEITFTDTSGRIFRDYAGYEDEEGVHKYTGFHAGKYIVTFYRIVGSDKVYWGDVEINVGKEQLTVTWDLDGNIPVAKVAGIYISDMIETVYTNGSGEEKTAQYILSTDGVPFYAEPRVTEKYAYNIGFVMSTGEVERYAFISSKFTPNAETKYLPKPKMLSEEQEWTGSPITFAVASWANYYNGFLYVSDGDLTQTAAGKYKVTLSFIKSANACWEDPKGSRSSVTLKFEIIMPTVVPLDKPVLQFDSIVYTGAATQFSIRNWVEYQNYLRIAEGSDNLTQTEPGTYHVTLEFFEGSTGCWQDGTRDPITLSFTIIPRNNQISKPSMAFAWAYYTGEDITFIINNWSYYSTYLTYEGDSLTQKAVGVYKITFMFKEGVSAFWESGDKNPFELSFEIKEEAPKYNITPNTALLDKPTVANSPQNYTGSPITFVIANWDTLSQYLEIAQGSDSLTQTAVGTYVLTLKFKSGVDACWKDSETQADLRLPFEIKSGSGPEIPPDAEFVTRPFLVLPGGTEPTNRADYTGSPIQFEIFNWSYYSNFLIIKSGSLTQTEKGTHTVIVGFRAGNNYYWEDSRDRADVTLNFYIGDKGIEPLALPKLDNTSLEFTGGKLIFTVTNWGEISQYVSVDKILNVNADGTLGEVASGSAAGGTISIDGMRIDNGKLQVGRYAVTIRIRDKSAAVWENGSTDDYVLYFEITKAVLTDASINDDGAMHIKSDKIEDFDSVLSQLQKDGIIDYEYTDANGNPVAKEDLVKGENYSVKMVIKDKSEFDKYFDCNAEVSEKLEKTYDITYTPAGEDINMIILVGAICLGVEFILFIILLVVLIKKRKALAEDED